MRLAVRRGGSGPTLFLIHGWALNSHVFDALIAHYNPRWTTLAIDLPGHGASSWPPSFADLTTLAERVAAELPLNSVVIGWSIGALVALQLAHAHADHVRALALIAATPCFTRRAHWAAGVEAHMVESLSTALHAGYANMVRDFLELQLRGSANAAAIVADLQRRVLGEHTPDITALEAALRVLQDSDLTPLLPQITQPTFAIAGQYDRIVAPSATQQMVSRMPNAHFATMRRTAHAPFLSHQQEFCALLDPFLDAQRTNA